MQPKAWPVPATASAKVVKVHGNPLTRAQQEKEEDMNVEFGEGEEGDTTEDDEDEDATDDVDDVI